MPNASDTHIAAALFPEGIAESAKDGAALRRTICGAPAENRGIVYQCTTNRGHIGDIYCKDFTDHSQPHIAQR